MSLEEALQRFPDAIFDLRAESPNDFVEGQLRSDWAPLKGVPALEKNCYHVIGGDYVLLPGPRLAELYRQMRQALEGCGF